MFLVFMAGGDNSNSVFLSFQGIGFLPFTAHMLPAVLLCLASAYVILKLLYRNPTTLRFKDPPEVVGNIMHLF